MSKTDALWVAEALPARLGDLAAHLPFRWARALCSLKLLLPFYHLASDEAPPHVRHLYPVRSTSDFRADLDFLGRYFRPVSLGEVVRHVREGRPFRHWSVHLTVDDGLRECHDPMAPILLEKGFPATFFLNSAFLDNRALMFRYEASLLADALLQKGKAWQEILPFDPLQIGYDHRDILGTTLADWGVDVGEFLQKEKPYLSSAQVANLLEKGFSIGGHSVDHPLYRALTEEEQLSQTLESQFFLEKKFRVKHRVFSFPFTDDGVRKSFLEKLHHKHGFQLTFGSAGLKHDAVPFHLQRLPMEKTAQTAKAIVGGAYLYWGGKSFFGKNTLRRS